MFGVFRKFSKLVNNFKNCLNFKVLINIELKKNYRKNDLIFKSLNVLNGQALRNSFSSFSIVLKYQAHSIFF